MRDVVGVGCNKNGAPIRPDESTEHPNSGLPLHDLTGGNAWVAGVLASAIPGSPNFDQVNYDLLHGPNLTLDMSAGSSNEPEAMIAVMERSKQQLELASSIDDLDYNVSTGDLTFKVQNNTGHKLLSGFPEGRRMFVNIKAYDAADVLIQEINPYDNNGKTLKGLHYNYDGQGVLPLPEDIGPNEVYVDELVYEAHTSSDLTGEDHTFHFALATDRYKDNRIPPKGFNKDLALDRLSEPKWGGASDIGYFTDAEYNGGYDAVSIGLVTGASRVEVNLYYQTTSREYVEFLRNEVNGTGNLTLPLDTGPFGLGDPDGPYLVQNDPSGFFDGLKGWGNALWGLWVHNVDKMGAAPFLMAQASVGVTEPPPACEAPTPTLLSADTASGQVTLIWSDESADQALSGYNVYYDQAGKSQFIADVALATSYTDAGLTNGQQYCYKVASYYADCESGFSNIICATPEAPGQDTLVDVVDPLVTGLYETTGKGKNQVTVFVTTDTFNAGAEVVILATVQDDGGLPVANASVEITFNGPETVTVTTGNSDVDGLAEAVWNTSAPNRKGNGGTAPGAYTATVTSVTGGGLVYSPTIIPGNASASIIIQ
jgi:hypothetical protein